MIAPAEQKEETTEEQEEEKSLEDVLFEELVTSLNPRDFDNYIRYIKYEDAVKQKIIPELAAKIGDKEVSFEDFVKMAGKLPVPNTDYIAFYHEKDGVILADLSRPKTFVRALKTAITKITQDKDALKMLRNAIYDKDTLINHGASEAIKGLYNAVVEKEFNESTKPEQKTFLIRYVSALMQNPGKTLDYMCNGDGEIKAEHVARLYSLFSQDKEVAENIYPGDAAAMYLLSTQTKDDEQLKQAVKQGIKNSGLSKLVQVGRAYRTVNRAIKKFQIEPESKHVTGMVENPANPDEKAVVYFAEMLENHADEEEFKLIAHYLRQSMESRAALQYLERDKDPEKRKKAMEAFEEYSKAA